MSSERTDLPPTDVAIRDRGARVDLSRTWELELFISGATVFALLRAPGMVDSWYAGAQPHLAGSAGLAAFLAYYYAKLILYTLIATFLLHLSTRAYWVGLVGLHSVYPHGVRWEELQYGPAFLDVFRRRLPSLEASIRRVDDLSSLLYSGGAVILLMFATSVIIMVPIGGISLVLAHTLLDGRHADILAIALIIVITTIPVIARSADLSLARRKGSDAGPDGADARPGRALAGAATVSYYLGVTPLVGPMSLVLSSNLGRRSATIAASLVFIGIVGLFLVRDVMLPRDVLRADSHIYLPVAAAAQETRPEHYAEQRAGAAVFPLTPHIQSEVVTSPYVRLFIPVVPEYHNALVAERCPGLTPLRGGLRVVPQRRRSGEPADITPLLECIRGLQPVSLNGVPLPELPYRMTTDPHSGVRGIVTHIPVSELGPGEYVLRVEGLPRALSERRSRPPRAPHLIRFWL